MTPVRATYRIQFNRDFTFAHAQAIVPYLADLGISHLYASPITTAQPGSTHGYDVVDPTQVNPELGGEAGLRSLVAALKRHGLGLIIDIVPNHMGIAGGNNPWWQDVLEQGDASAFARFFDINWREPLLLPFLGEPLAETIAAGQLRLEESDGRFVVLAYGSTPYPIRAEDQDAIRREGAGSFTGERLAALLDRQHYRLAWWRTANDDLHWRRFFTITELAGLRIEDDQVFEAVHALPFRLYAEGLIDGVRVDHVDGLTDPAAYLHKLRERLNAILSTGHAEPVEALPFSSRAPNQEGPGFDKLSLSGRGDSRTPYILIEKILAADEPLDPDWPVDGTTGYDFMADVAAVLHDPAGEDVLTRFWSDLSGRPADFHAEETQARQDMLAWEFEGQLTACVNAFAALAATDPATAAFTHGMLRRAVERMLWVFPVYRTYGTGVSAPPGDAQVRDHVRANASTPPGEARLRDAILAWLAGTGPGDPALAADAVRRFQQLSAPIAAKAVEDTAFYRYGRLLSGNDVGFDPARFAMPADAFHARMAARAAAWPRAMLATATHDHKRGEDVRGRLAVLSAIAEEWIDRARHWLPHTEAIAPDDGYALLQTLVGAWPLELGADDGPGLRAFADRVAAWQEKALREAKLRSSWAEPDADYEARARDVLMRMLDPAQSPGLLAEVLAFVHRIAPAAQANSLVQAFLRNTLPGVPDLYQGCEFADLSLVDPDNRRPVDFAARTAALQDQAQVGFEGRKQRLIYTLLRLRSRDPDLFVGGDYIPVPVTGRRADHVLAFTRRSGGATLLAAAALRCAEPVLEGDTPAPPATWWGNTALDLPADLMGAPLLDPLSGSTGSVSPAAAALFAGFPVALRVSVPD